MKYSGSDAELHWTPVGLRNSSTEWWAEIFLHHRVALEEKVGALLAKATEVKGGCLELGTEEDPVRVHWRGRRLRAYQLVAWGKAGRAPRTREVVRHLCNNRACINPKHLRVGTQRQNLNDQRLRKAERARHWSHPK